jgi:hypothetical protein
VAKYAVSVVRHEVVHKVATIEVEAVNRRLARQEAKKQILSKPTGVEWKEYDEHPMETHYSIEFVQAVKEPTAPPPPTEKKEGGV